MKMDLLTYLFSILLTLTVFVSGIGRDILTTTIACAILTICVGLVVIKKQKTKIILPKNFGYIFLFITILWIYPVFVHDKLNPIYNALIYTVGLFLFLIFHNLKNKNEIIYELISKLVIAYSFLYLYTKIFRLDSVPFAQLYFTEGLASRHYHVGDLWAFALTLIISRQWGKFNLKTWLLIDIGFLFLVLANARSAYLSLAVGFMYMTSRKLGDGNFKKLIPTVFMSLIVLLFIFSSVNKSTIFSRPYFLQSIEAFPKYPLGIGMGNFKQIGLEFYNKTGDPSKFSLYTHNIFLEALSGVGVFSVFFLMFLYSTVKDILVEKKKNIVWRALVLAILTNFMFDTTYTIPGLVWIIFMSLGVFQSKKLTS